MTGILYTVIPVKTVINITVVMLKTVTIFGPSTGVKLEQITPGILKNTPVTRNTVNLIPKIVRNCDVLPIVEYSIETDDGQTLN